MTPAVLNRFTGASSMYVPAAFAETDRETLFAFIEAHSFAILVSGDGDLFASHLPLFLDRAGGPHGALLGHMARANPQWEQAGGKRVLAVFSGPHAYVSPTWYEADGTVPTWNYVAVHAAGTLRVIDDEAETLRVLARTVEQYERSMPRPWRFDPAVEVSRRLVKAVVAFRIEIDRLEGKRKLGQNHSDERRRKVIAALRAAGGSEQLATAHLMEQALTAELAPSAAER